MTAPQNAYHHPYRWVVLLFYMAVAGTSQMLWLNFAPLILQVQTRYGVSELMASSLLLVFPLLYVVLSLNAGSMTDHRGYRFTIGAGSVVMALFACVRMFDASFYALLIGQIGIAVAQPYVINGISKLVADWFSEEHSAMATGLGTAGMLLGMALGLGLTPALAGSIGFHHTMMVFAGMAVAAATGFVLFVRENKHEQSFISHAKGMEDFKVLLKNKDLVTLFIISFLALGFFNGLTSWLEPILKMNDINAEEAGFAGALLIIGGIIGSAVVPAISDKYKRRKPFLILCCIVACLLLLPMCMISKLREVYTIAALMGFFFLPGYALLLSMTEELAGPQRAGAATGFIMLTGNAGAVVVILAMEMVKGDAGRWMNAVYLLLALLVVTLLITIGFLGETFHANGK